MKGHIGLLAALALAACLAGCSAEKAPAVTPTPSAAPSAAVTDNGGASAAQRMGDDVRRSMDGMGDMVEDAGRGLEDAVRNGQVFR